MKNIIPVFVGYDPREAIAYHTCVNSIIRNSSQPVAIVPVALSLFRDYAETHTDGSNQFIYTRFLVPHLMEYTGHAIFIDGDMIVRGDIAELWNLRDVYKDVQVVKHDYKTRMPVKYLGAKNEDYPRKNWSSVILWNCASFPNRALTPEFVQQSTGSELHRFSWIDDDRIGSLPQNGTGCLMNTDQTLRPSSCTIPWVLRAFTSLLIPHKVKIGTENAYLQSIASKG